MNEQTVDKVEKQKDKERQSTKMQKAAHLYKLTVRERERACIDRQSR